MEIIAQQVIWNCNKKLLFEKVSRITVEIEKRIIEQQRSGKEQQKLQICNVEKWEVKGNRTFKLDLWCGHRTTFLDQGGKGQPRAGPGSVTSGGKQTTLGGNQKIKKYTNPSPEN